MLRFPRSLAGALDRAPTVATPVVLARGTGFLYIAADVFSGSAMVSQWDRVVNPWGASGFVALTFAVGVLVWRRGESWPRLAFHLLLVGGTLLTSVSIVMSPGGSTAVALSSIYALVCLQASFFFRFRLTLAHLALCLISCAVASRAAGGVGLAEYFLVVGEIVIVSCIVGWLVRVAADSEVDSLTGLPNRRGLDRLLAEQLARRGAGADSGLVLGILDIDYFKAVNDTAGHAAGDRLLRDCAATWSGLLVDAQVLARAGGDEFILVLPDAGRESASALVDRLRTAVPDRTCTVGLAEWEPGDSAAMLLGR